MKHLSLIAKIAIPSMTIQKNLNLNMGHMLNTYETAGAPGSSRTVSSPYSPSFCETVKCPNKPGLLPTALHTVYRILIVLRRGGSNNKNRLENYESVENNPIYYLSLF